MTNHQWNWFYTNVRREAKCFVGIELQFIYYGVIITDVYGNKRAEFSGDDLVKLFDSVQMYLIHNYKRRAVRIIVKNK